MSSRCSIFGCLRIAPMYRRQISCVRILKSPSLPTSALCQYFFRVLCKPTRIDLSFDLSEDTMPRTPGFKYWPSQKAPMGVSLWFRWLGGNRIEDSVGRTSALLKQFGEQRLCSRHSILLKSWQGIAILHNKCVEGRERADKRCGNKSQIAVRILVRVDESEKLCRLSTARL
jgi:hypothetical protein